MKLLLDSKSPSTSSMTKVARFQMLDILEKFVLKRGYKSLSMDGTTAISSRQHLINKFNTVRKAYFVLHLCFRPTLVNCIDGLVNTEYNIKPVRIQFPVQNNTLNARYRYFCDYLNIARSLIAFNS